jgi:hypothetical protein
MVLIRGSNSSLSMGTDTLASKTPGIAAVAAIIVVGVVWTGCDFAPDLPATVGVPTHPADDQPLQQVTLAPAAAASAATVLRKLVLNDVEEVGIDDRRDRNRDPLLGANAGRVGAAAGRRAGATHRPEPGRGGCPGPCCKWAGAAD